MKNLMLLLVGGVVAVGCVGQTDADQRAKAEEFNEAAVEKAMKESGKEQELAEAKEREAAYLANSNSGATEDESKEGPTSN